MAEDESPPLKVKCGRKKLPEHMRKKMFSFRIDQDLYKKLRHYSKPNTPYTMAHLIEVSIKEFLSKIKL